MGNLLPIVTGCAGKNEINHPASQQFVHNYIMAEDLKYA